MAAHRKRMVLLGGGHSHVEVLRRFGMGPIDAADLTLIARDYEAPYSGMLPGFIAGHYTRDQCHIDLRPLARRAGCRVYHDEAVGLDLEQRRVFCKDRPPVPFDILSINIGSTPAMADVPGAREHALPAKPVDRFIARWEDIQARARATNGVFRVVVVGGGAGGVELALTMRHKLRGLHKDQLEFHVLTDTPEVLPTHNAGARRRMERALRARGVAVHTGARVVRVTPNAAETQTGLLFPYDALIWVTHASPAPWFRESGLATDDRGFIAVDETLRSPSHSFVFAAGDCATFVADPRPKSGVFAVREGPYLAANLRHAVLDEPLERFKPQKNFLSLISTGDQYAIASRGNWSLEGQWVWKWKDRIDTTWMRKYQMPNGMVPPARAMAGTMRCGGCGAKVASDVLHRVLRRLDVQRDPRVLVGLERPDDAAVVDPPPGKLAVHTVDFFRSFLDDPHAFGRVAAVHCLNDLYAMGAAPHTALATITLPYDRADVMESTLYDVLSGACRVLNAEGAALVGGHTTEGAELAFGLTLNGFVSREDVLGKGRLRPGDALILTKPIGTGVIFAADMHGRARGRWIDAAVEAMLASNRDALECFRRHGATACTDVSGFGLAGHLLEMLDASNAAAEINLSVLPMIDGAAAAITAGARSTLHPANEQAASRIEVDNAAAGLPAYHLLFDPQTAGGLLAALPADTAETCLEDLRVAGCPRAALIGHATRRIDGRKLIQVFAHGRG